MSPSERNPEEGANAEGMGAKACCAPGCNCGSAPARSGMRMAIGVVILVAAGVLVARAVIKADRAKGYVASCDFGSVTAQASASETSEDPGAAAGAAKVDGAELVEAAPDAPGVTTIAGKEIAALSELNQVAGDTDAVFVYLPAADAETSQQAPVRPLNGAVQTISAQGYKVGVFTLSSGAPEYAQLATQMEVPSIVAIVKGRGMAPVTGEITETKLVQGFVAASSAGGCCPGGASTCQ